MILHSIAVLLAAYNGKKWLVKQIQTILDQKTVDLHLYISIDLSTDNTFNIASDIAKNNHKITILPYGVQYGSAAPNFYYLLNTVPIEDYDYIALSDQDDIWLEDKLSHAISVLEKQNCSGYSSNVTAFWENGKERTIKKSYPQMEFDYLFEGPGPGCSFVLKKAFAIALKKDLALLKKFDWHDWLIYAYARTNAYKWVIDDASYLLYRQHANNQLGANSGLFAFFKRVSNIYSGYGINQTLAIIQFLGLEDNTFIKKWYKEKKINYIILALNSKKCRRKNMDKLFFFISCIIMTIIKPKINT